VLAAAIAAPAAAQDLPIVLPDRATWTMTVERTSERNRPNAAAQIARSVSTTDVDWAADGDGGDPSPDARLFRAARELMRQDLSRTPELEALARAVGSNKRRLGEAFRAQTGTTVFDYLRELRLREAHRQLAETTLDIQTIAQDVGYSSGANFSTAFRERFGLSPRQFRQAASKAKA